ncbi:MAG: tRNA preQ1(34) S-adenosylmethionine ribosyltransferase-isomerase QueA [Gemmatimonadota bacterium]
MTAERPLRTADFDYLLPTDLIAQEPVAERGESRLLVTSSEFRVPSSKVADRLGTRNPELLDGKFADLVTMIPPDDLLVLNTTKVRHARFLGARQSGAPAEVLLIHPAQEDRWIAIGKPGSALRPGKQIRIGDDAYIETVAVLDEGYREVRFVGISAEEAIRTLGRLPLPPYIERDPTADDETRYQTVYAERENSVAAPTAGLHFTPALLRGIEDRGVRVARIELEVGPGTFKPVETEDPATHPMHPEWYEIPEAAARAIGDLRARGGKLWAVGTTVVRALESAATDEGTVRSGRAETRLLITPGYRFRVVDRLLTNFHLPRSTLLMLVCAFGGYDRVMAAYRHAVAARYRFYSYGDAMVIL